MKILITNDDGVEAAQLPGLIRWARKLGQVTVVVPKFEQSAKSHSIQIRDPMEIKQRDLADDITVWTVDSSPADCVRFATAGLKESFDLVISGVNRGYNLGSDIQYSGTMAAASEAVHKGMKAVALSTAIPYYPKALSHLDAIFAFLEERKLLEYHGLYNINIPADPKGIRITRMGECAFRETFEPLGNDLYAPAGKPVRPESTDLTMDTVAAMQGYITVTPMTIDRTDYGVYQKISE